MEISITDNIEIYSSITHSQMTEDQFEAMSEMKNKKSEDTVIGSRLSAFLEEE
jgi:hypothetical protein